MKQNPNYHFKGIPNLLHREPTIHLFELSENSDHALLSVLTGDDFHVVPHLLQQIVPIAAGNEKPDLVLLNLTGGESGILGWCRNLSAAYPGITMCLIHDSLSEWEESIALELGADAVIGHPSEPRRVLAQVRALLRRQNGSQPRDFKLQEGSRTVKVKGVSISLTDAEFELLRVLARQPGEVVSRDTISHHMRGLAHDGRNRIIDLRIARIRQKLGDSARNPQYIRTVRGEGYMLMIDTP